MEILLSFQEKPRNASKQEAIQIAEGCGARIENGRVIVPFREFTQDAMELLSRCKKWKGFTLSINGKEYDPHAIIDVLDCSEKLQCEGICRSYLGCSHHHYKFLVSQIDDMIRYAPHFSHDRYLSPDLREWMKLNEWVEAVDDTTVMIKREHLHNSILRDSAIPLLVCDECTPERIAERIDRLPEMVAFGKKLGQGRVERPVMSEAGREAELWFGRGADLSERHDYAGAIEAYDRALALNPDDVRSIFNRGCDLLALERYGEAEAAFARAYELNPEDAYTFKFWALSLQGLGRGEKAAELMARAERLQPGIRDIPFP